MKLNKISIVVVLSLCTAAALPAQGKYLNPAAQREMDKPIITASSTLPPGSSSNYSPDNLMDGTSASWSEGVKGSGIGEYLQVDFRFPDEMIYVMIKNGFGKEKYWKANARIRKIKISNEEGDTRVIHLEDIPELQVVGLNYIEENEDGVMDATGGLYGSSFKFEILEVYPGERWQDACITEIDFNQWYKELFPMTDDYIFQNLYQVYFEGVFDQTGALYIESDWDGYVEFSTEDGCYFEEIVSGDGTEGFEEYQAFINNTSQEYFMLSSGYIKELDFEHIDFNEEVQDDPKWFERFEYEFSYYDDFAQKFNMMDHDMLDQLFDINPLIDLSDMSGDSLNWEDIWIVISGFENVIKAVYPLTVSSQELRPDRVNYFEYEVYYKWVEKEFIKQSKGLFEPTGGDLGADEDEYLEEMNEKDE